MFTNGSGRAGGLNAFLDHASEISGLFKSYLWLIAVMIAIPITLLVPLTFVSIPPRMILRPAMLSLQVQFTSRSLSLTAARPVLANGFVEFDLGLLDSMLALCSIVRV